MKALDLLKNNMVLRKAVEPNYLNEAIKELEELENIKNTVIEYLESKLK